MWPYLHLGFVGAPFAGDLADVRRELEAAVL